MGKYKQRTAGIQMLLDVPLNFPGKNTVNEYMCNLGWHSIF